MEEEKQENKNPNALKRIDMQSGSFTANGKQYFVEGSLSIERYAEFQILEKELAYGYSVKGIYDELKQITKLMDKLRFVDCSVKLINLTRGIAKLEEREPVVLKICALFCNTETEDRTIINADMMTRKIEDWKKEGIDMRDFFELASSSVNGFLEIYRNVILSISERQETSEAGNP